MDLLYLDSLHNTQAIEGCVLYLLWQFRWHDIMGCSEPVRSPDRFSLQRCMPFSLFTIT